MKTSSTIKLGVVFAAAVAAGFALWTIRPTVTVATAQRGPAVNAVPANVEVSAEYALTLSSELGGTVAETGAGFAVGQTVAKGDLLAQLDPADINLAIDRENTDLAAAKKKIETESSLEPQLLIAQQDLADAEARAKGGQAASEEVERNQNTVHGLVLQLAQERTDEQQKVADLENDLATSKRQLEKTRITAPIDGTVTVIETRAGETIPPGAPLATILSRARRVEAEVSEEKRAGIRQGQKATVWLLSYPGQEFEATVKQILPAAEDGTQRFGVLLDMKIDPELLVPGLTGTANIVVGEHADALIIPRRALVDGNVLVVERGRIALRKVTPGFQSLNDVEIVDGLKEGDLVVVEEMNRFQPGDRVRPTTER
jgi:multidrug efflux pump subunit AcrA (membrane-fusion protein)